MEIEEEKKSDFYWEPTKYLLLVTAIGLFLLNVKQSFRKIIIILYFTDEYIVSFSFIEQLYHCCLFLCKVLCLNFVSNVNIIAKYIIWRVFLIWYFMVSTGFQGGSVVKNPSANAGISRDACSIPGLGRFPGRGSGNQLQYFCLENPMDRAAWWTTVHESQRCEHDRATNTFIFFARDEENTEIGNWL